MHGDECDRAISNACLMRIRWIQCPPPEETANSFDGRRPARFGRKRCVVLAHLWSDASAGTLNCAKVEMCVWKSRVGSFERPVESHLFN